MIVNRIAAMALMFTGLSREAARFQARSAFSGCGFTTTEAESIVNHPVRRKIVMILMLLGNIGVATVVATVIISISSATNSTWQSQLVTLGIFTAGIVALFFLFSSKLVGRYMNKLIAWALKRFSDLDVRDYVSLLNLSDGYSVSEMVVDGKHWMAEQRLKDLRLSDEGILILGIRHQDDAKFVGVPKANDQILAGDTLIVYGKLDQIRALDNRRCGASGDKQHRQAVLALGESKASEKEATAAKSEKPLDS